MKNGLNLLNGFIFLATSSLTAADWLNLPKWDEGLAEVCLYDGQIIKYGILRDSTLELISVREHFDPEKLVKTSSPTKKTVIPIMKINIVKRTRTGIYEYVQMASVFINRDSGRLEKLSCVSSEWCGNSFALFENRPPAAGLILSNYMDDMGTSQIPNPIGDGNIFYDQLVPYLRQHLHGLEAGRQFPIIKSLLTNKPAYLTDTATIESVRKTIIRAGGRRYRAYDIAVGIGKRTERFTLADTPERTLLQWRSDASEYYRLRKVTFLDYWNRNRPGDEKLLKRR